MEETRDKQGWEVKCLSLLKSGACNDALQLLLNNISESGASSYSFISGLFQFISKEEKDSLRYNASVSMLNCIAEKCQVDDVVVDLIETCDENFNVEQFRILLELYLKLFSRECKRKDIFLDWCLSYTRGYLQKACSGSESSDVQCLILQLFYTFIGKLSLLFSPLSEKVKTHLCNAIIFIVGLNIHENEKIVASKVFLNISADPFAFLPSYRELNASGGADDSETSYRLALANFFYIVITAEEISHPQVYSHQFLFLSLLPLISELLDSSEDKFVCKGLQLVELFTPLLQNCLALSELSSTAGNVLEKLNHIMVFHEERAVRTKALKCFETVISCYNPKAQYHLFLHFRPRVSHSGTLALMLSKIKQLFDLSRRNPNDLNLQYFNGKRLFDVVKAYGYLQGVDETQVVSNADQILASLNLFWYLATLNLKGNFIVSNFIPDLKLNFLKPLKSLITKGLENCEKELKRLCNGEQLVSNDNDVGITVNNLPLPNISVEEQMKTVYCARNAIELMQINFQKIVDVVSDIES